MEQKIVIVDYGMGNVGSIRNMLKHIGFRAIISGTLEDIRNADKLILSGVGAFDSAMNKISGTGLLDALNIKVMEEKTPLLGICLGMQLFSHASEEGLCRGLGGSTPQRSGSPLRDPLPVSGSLTWLEHIVDQESSPIISGDARGYEVLFRSFLPRSGRPKDMTLATTHYGYDFTSVIAKDNICGVQFHPEKSHKFGMKLLNNFINLM